MAMKLNLEQLKEMARPRWQACELVREQRILLRSEE